MYLRFVSPLRHEGRRGVNLGLFQAAFHCRDERHLPKWHVHQLLTEIEWFKANLPSPDAQHFKPWHQKTYHWQAMCWFKGEAVEMVDHARNLAWLIEEAGLPLCTHKTKEPGTISYADRYQIVAYPKRGKTFGFQ